MPLRVRARARNLVTFKSFVEHWAPLDIVTAARNGNPLSTSHALDVASIIRSVGFRYTWDLVERQMP